MTITQSSYRAIAKLTELPDRINDFAADALSVSVAAGAEAIKADFQMGLLSLKPRRPAAGIASSIIGWMLDQNTGAIGIPGNSPAAIYAAVHTWPSVSRRTIRPRKAKALAIPLTDEAKRFGGPRQMADEGGHELFLVKQKNGAYLAEKRGRKIICHWVLKRSVVLPHRPWLTEGIDRNKQIIREAFHGRLHEKIQEATK